MSTTFCTTISRVYGLGQARSSSGHPPGGVQEQEVGVQLVRVRPGAHYVSLLGALCGAEEVPHSQGRAVPVQEHVPVCERGFSRASHQVNKHAMLLLAKS